VINISHDRLGSDNDVRRLKSTLPRLGLALYLDDIHQDYTKGKIGTLIKDFANNKDSVHSTGDCAVLIVMAHGNEKEEITCGPDINGKRSNLKIDTIIEMFSNDNATVLAEKPVLLMFACCR
jgi:hypothetical protein